MLTALSIVKSNGGGTINFNVAAVPTTYTAEEFEFGTDLAGDEIGRAEQSGQFENFVYVTSQQISLQGMILGTTATAYAANRLALMTVVLPDSGIQTVRAHGTIYPTFTGLNQMYAPVQLTDITAPLAVDEGPFESAYHFIWRNPYGYFRYVSGGADVKF